MAFTVNYDASYYSNMIFLWHLMRLITGLAIQLNYGVSRELIGLKARGNRANLHSVDWYIYIGLNHFLFILRVSLRSGITESRGERAAIGGEGTAEREKRNVSYVLANIKR